MREQAIEGGRTLRNVKGNKQWQFGKDNEQQWGRKGMMHARGKKSESRVVFIKKHITIAKF